MLGYKHILPINVFIFGCVLVFIMTFTPWWATICRDALPGHPETGFFYHMVVNILLYWNLGVWMNRQFARNRRRYNEQYELEVNNFLQHFTPLMYHKLSRHVQFGEFNNLLLQAIGQARQLVDIVNKEGRNGL